MARPASSTSPMSRPQTPVEPCVAEDLRSKREALATPLASVKPAQNVLHYSEARFGHSPTACTEIFADHPLPAKCTSDTPPVGTRSALRQFTRRVT